MDGRCFAEVDYAALTRGLKVRPGTTDGAVVGQIFRGREYDLTRLRRWPELLALLGRHHCAGRRPLIVDAGANVGASAVFFAAMFPTARIVAIEPEESNFALLVENARGRDVRCIKAALASASGHMALVDPGYGHWAYRTERIASSTGVPCVTMDELYAEELRDATLFPFIVKIDIECGEEELFSQNTGWVARTPVIAVELHDWFMPGVSRPFFNCVEPLDRDPGRLGENTISLDNAALAAAALTAAPSA
jgi:FkbM family methyltransferase